MKFKTYYSNKFIITAILMSILGALFLVALPQCAEIDKRKNKKDNAIQVESKVYYTPLHGDYVEVVEIEGYKIIMWYNGNGSDMEIIPIKPKEDE